MIDFSYKILLGSNSPRRKELLGGMGLDFEVVTRGSIDESFPAMLRSREVPEYLALKKARAYADLLVGEPKKLVLTADTVVVLDKAIIGKPDDEEEAVELLTALQGRTHRVYTGVALTTAAMQRSFTVKTKVTMRPLSEAMIRHYVETYKPLDKAGAYGIQEWIGLVAIDHIEGSFQNVMGLPTQRLFQELSYFEN